MSQTTTKLLEIVRGACIVADESNAPGDRARDARTTARLLLEVAEALERGEACDHSDECPECGGPSGAPSATDHEGHDLCSGPHADVSPRAAAVAHRTFAARRVR